MTRRSIRRLIAIVTVSLSLSSVPPAHAWSYWNCEFDGTSWMGAGVGYAKTTEWDFTCTAVSAKVKYKVDGYWYSTGNAYGSRWVVQETLHVYPSDVTGAHRGKDAQKGWSSYRYSY